MPPTARGRPAEGFHYCSRSGAGGMNNSWEPQDPPTPDVPQGVAKRARTARSSLLRRPVTPAMALLVVLGIAAFRIWLVETAIVDGHSMVPTLQPDDRVLVLKPAKVERFSVVVMTDPEEGGIVIKRVVGLPGDSVALIPRALLGDQSQGGFGAQLFVNRLPYREPYAQSIGRGAFPPLTVPKDHYFVLGDNRDDSVDSRCYGPVPKDLIQGVGVAVVYPFGRAGLLGLSAEPLPGPSGENSS